MHKWNFSQPWSTSSLAADVVQRALGPRNVNIHQLAWERDALSADERALIISPRLQIDRSKRMVASLGGFSDEAIKAGLLMWDRFDVPSNTMLGTGSVIVDSLVSFGVAKRSIVIANGEMSEGIHQVYEVLFNAYEKINPNAWSLMTGPEGLDILSGSQLSSAVVNFNSCIPFPTADVPIERILEFRTRRRVELHSLRSHIEDVVTKIRSAGDGELAIDTEVARFKQAAEDHLRVAKESGLKFKLGDMSGSINLLGPVAGGLVAYAQNLPIIPGLIAGAVASVSITPSITFKYNRVGSTPLRYISLAHTELPW